MRTLRDTVYMHFETGVRIVLGELESNGMELLHVDSHGYYPPENWEELPPITIDEAIEKLFDLDDAMLYIRDTKSLKGDPRGRWINFVMCNGWGDDLIANWSLIRDKDHNRVDDSKDVLTQVLNAHHSDYYREVTIHNLVTQMLLDRITELETQVGIKEEKPNDDGAGFEGLGSLFG